MKTAEQTMREIESSVERWNEANPVGTEVYYWPGIRDFYHAEMRRGRSRTRTPAWNMSGFPMVSVDGYPGGIALTHIEVIPTRENRRPDDE